MDRRRGVFDGAFAVIPLRLCGGTDNLSNAVWFASLPPSECCPPADSAGIATVLITIHINLAGIVLLRRRDT